MSMVKFYDLSLSDEFCQGMEVFIYNSCNPYPCFACKVGKIRLMKLCVVKMQCKLNFKHAYFSLNSNISKWFCLCQSFPLNHHHMGTGYHFHMGIPNHRKPSVVDTPKVTK